MNYSIDLTKSEMMTRVLKHFAKQGHRAMDEFSCRYRTNNGDKCAIGCLLEDSQYTPEIEGKGVWVFTFPKASPRFAGALQACHDNSDTLEDLKRSIRRASEEFEVMESEELEKLLSEIKEWS